jgi:Tfp pilus assembly protein PilZ
MPGMMTQTKAVIGSVPRMKILRLRIKSHEEWQSCLSEGGTDGAIFVPTTEPLTAGDEVVIEIASPGLPNKVLIRGQVETWRPALPRLRVRAGATVRFAPAEEHKREFVSEALAGRRADAPRRRHDRFPVTVAVRYRIGQLPELHEGFLAEISAGGAMLTTESPLPMGQDVIIEVAPPGSVAPMTIQSRVSYHVPTGGTGLKFLYRDGDGSRRLRELVRRLVAH